MKNTLCNIIFSIAITMAVLPLLSAGCHDREVNVGYHYITIPGFEEADYIAMLNSSNEAMQYNALCYLAEHDNYDQYLTTDSLKDTPRYDTALLLYRKVYPLMDSKNTWVASSAIRFISIFQYNREDYLNHVLSNNTPSMNVQLEIIMDIAADTINDQQLLQQKINFLLQQPSWLLQNGAYQVMGQKENLDLNQLMQVYNNSREDYTKLLILDVFENQLTDPVFVFLNREWERSTNGPLKNQLFYTLIAAKNHQLVLDWYTRHPGMLEKDMARILEMLADEQQRAICGKLIRLALEKGWKPATMVQEKRGNGLTYDYDGEPLLYIKLFLEKYKQANADSVNGNRVVVYKEIENTLMQYPALKNEWLAFEKRWSKYALPEALINQHRKLTAAYLQQTSQLLKQYGVDTGDTNYYIDLLNRDAGSLQKIAIRRKE